MTATTTDVAASLHGWARGSYALVAAVELLIRSFGGQFADPFYPWVRWDEGAQRYWLDATQFDRAGGLSSGERVVLAFVAALAAPEDEHPLDLTDIARLDRRHQGLVLAAIAHAGGSYEHRGRDGQPLGSLYPWPEETP